MASDRNTPYLLKVVFSNRESESVNTLQYDGFDEGRSKWTLLGGSLQVRDGIGLVHAGSSLLTTATNTVTDWTDYSVNLLVRVQSGSSSVLVRCQATNTSEDCYSATLDTDSGTVKIYEVVSNVPSLIGESSRVPIRPGLIYAYQVVVEGSHIHGSVDGERVVSATSDRYSSGGVGLSSVSTDLEVFDLAVLPLDPSLTTEKRRYFDDTRWFLDEQYLGTQCVVSDDLYRPGAVVMSGYVDGVKLLETEDDTFLSGTLGVESTGSTGSISEIEVVPIPLDTDTLTVRE